MGGLTPPKKPSASQMRQKAIKCAVELDIQSTFVGAVDPGAVAEHLENDTTSLELIQLIPPEGEILATFEEDTREFLYPGPRLTPRSPGPEREILMKRSISFPSCGRSSTKPCHVKTCPANAKKKPGTAPSCGYEKPTVASQSRAPSPYTHRKMCQLSEEARQRLSHFKLGPYIYKKETVPQAPFVEASMQATRSPQNKSPKDHSTPVSITLRDQSPVLSRSSLRERFQSSSSPSQSEEIHKRVQRILNIHGPRCKLSFDEESEEEEGVRQSSRVSSHRDSVIDSWLPQDRLIPAEPSVNLDGGTFWTKRAAAYTGKPHRAAFEDSLSKIYKNLYRNASQTGHSGQSTSTQ
ncbi:Spermatogenesis-associated protein 6 [Labeo rohita]|uniref:Spermatogenesis-associated protein 6 n=1 Tax=Labeo rohita TaxID=84645 RepID=A0ABQ8MGR1_LABRO|nr:Spermatogenesis-associated protein 6 [Labeo rohita]